MTAHNASPLTPYASLLTPNASPLVGFEGKLVFDASKPDGTPRKLQDVSRMDALGWRPRIALEDGIRGTYEWYSKQLQV